MIIGIEGEVAVKRMMKGSVRIDSQFGTEIGQFKIQEKSFGS